MKKIMFTSTLLSIFLLTGCGIKLSNDTVVNVGGKDGLLRDNSKVIIKPIYERINSFEGDYNKYYHPNYLNVHWFHDDSDDSYAIVQNIDEKYGIINKKGELQLKVIYDSISKFYNGFARVEINGKFGYINEEFEVVIKPIYDEAQEFLYNTAIVKYNNKYGCINKDLEIKIKPIFDMIYLQSEGLQRIELDDKWGFLDMNCNVIVKPLYNYAYDFSNGFAKVKSGKNWGFIDTKGNLLTKPIFEDTDRF